MFSSTDKLSGKKTGHFSSRRQQGVAIITALLIVTLAATISITISTQLQLDVRRTGNIIATDQAHIYSVLAEETLQVILRDDDLRDGFIELLIKEGIAKQPLFIDNAAITAEVTDLNACLNINSLIDDDGTINTVSEARLKRLFENHGITTNLTPAIADWIDPDLNTSNAGAEDGHYMNLEKPYRTAQLPLYSISELRLIKGFEDNKVYQAISQLVDGTLDKESGRFSGPELCAFKTDNYNININTASAKVLKSLAISDEQVEKILTQRTDTVYKQIPTDIFTNNNDNTIVANSSYYLLKSKVVIGSASKVMYSIIHWDPANKQTKTISRTQRAM
jgi:general secretion pathway protein K